MTDQPRPRRIDVSDTGAATAHSGGYANTGVHIGDVNLHTGVPVRTHYRHQVQRIAPPQLLDREPELADLAEFCTSPDTAGRYQWWQAGAWSGKTALLAWFVLHPPPGVRIVSFFITARLAGQNNRSAFLDNLLEQLLALLGETVPPFLTEATREPHLLSLLDTAAQLCQDRGEHLVLLVDGLDEDRGVTTGPDAHSIAALLPADPPAGLRVLVAGRPNPPVPADVPPHHPLRAKDIIRPLPPSPAAQAIRHEMERDLHGLLRGSPLEQDLLGLITAAGGGLTMHDLVELTGCSPWDVANHLSTVTGRSFARRASHYFPDESEVFLLGHEEIQLTAQDMLGPARLAAYRDRLHTWAEGYRDRGWPPGTPEYLVRGYHTMLTAIGDLPRLTALVTDPARQERMHDYSGSDSNALAEIVAVLAAHAERTEPDLTAITRLAIHRDHLHDRHNDIPASLPAAWALVGQVSRAEALLQFLSSGQIDGRLVLAEVLHARGERSRAAQLLAEARALARAQGRLYSTRSYLLSVAETEAKLGDPAVAGVLLAEVEDRAFAGAPEECADILPDLVTTGLRCGATGRTAEIITRAEAAARASTEPVDRAELMLATAQACAATGDLDRARALAEEVGLLVPSVDDRPETLLKGLARVLAQCGAADQAEEIARGIDGSHDRDQVLQAVALAFARAGDPRRCAAATRGIADPNTAVETMVQLAEVLADRGDHEEARQWLSTATAFAAGIGDGYERALAHAELGGTFIRLGELDQAEAAARAIEDTEMHATVLISVARAHQEMGATDRASALINDAYAYVRAHGDRFRQAETLLATATACLRAGDNRRAAEHIRTAVPWARGDDQGVGRGYLLCRLIATLSAAGEVEQARALADSVPEDWRDTAAELLTDGLIAAGDLVRAETIARAIPTSRVRCWALLTIADAWPGHGRPERAAELIDEVAAAVDDRDVFRPEEVRARLAESMSGHVGPRAAELLDRAEAIASGLPHHLRITVLSSVALGRIRLDQLDLARTLLAKAERKAAEAPHLSEDSLAWSDVVHGVAALGDFDHAERLATALSDRNCRDQALSHCVRLLAEHGDLPRAERLAGEITGRERLVRSMLRVATRQPDAARRDRLLDEAEQVAADRADLLTMVAGHAPERAVRLLARAIQLGPLNGAVGVLAQLLPTAIDTIEAELAVVHGD